MPDISALEKLTEIFHDVFDDESIILTRSLTARDVRGWDSLTNIRLFVEVEKRFGVRFSAAEIASLGDVGQLVDRLERKRSRSA
jgi:acyl carrier protein